MSELKVYVKPLKTNMFGKTIVGQSYYLKSEADKVIAEKDKKIDLYKRGWEESDRINEHLYAQLRHHKYKRCLAMARWCNEKWLVHNFAEIPTKLGFYDKWEKRWLALAEKFKEAK